MASSPLTRAKCVLCILVTLCLAARISFAEDSVSLAGEWRFALDRGDTGTSERWFEKKLPHQIQLPGILEAQGYGDPICINTPWVLSLYDHGWYLRADYAAYTNDGDVKVPFLCQPPRHYLGAAWYQRDVEIPENWKGKHITLFLERPHWKTTLWLDNRELGSDISLCTPHEYELGMEPAGKHRLTIRVDNRMILAYRPDAHSVSDSLDDAWNGIVGKIELRATDPVWVDDVRIFPDAEKKSIRARMTLHNSSGIPVSGKIEFYVEAMPGTTPIEPTDVMPISENINNWDAIDVSDTDTCIETEIDLGDKAKLWSEFSPALYCLRVDVGGGSDKFDFDEQTTNVFGLRDFHAQGNQFILNGRPIYFRGTHFGGDFPLTGYPATDLDSWKRIFKTCKRYGLNHMRFHSWCPPEAAFEAADDLGFYLQVECGMWNSFTPGGQIEKQLYSETERIIRAYGNHPSLMLVSASNEAAGRWKQVLPEWVKHFRAEDPRHLYTPDTGWALIDSPDEPIDGGADYLAVGRIGPNHVRGPAGWFGNDYRDFIAGVNVPIIGHEVGQWCAYPDFDVIKKFMGFMKPGNFEIFRDSAAAHGLLDEDKNFAWASGRFQVECYKEEIEANLRTPGLDGFQLLDLHDYTGQGTALVGLLDAFWESKGYTNPEEFTKFCNAVVPLAPLKTRVFTTADQLKAPVEIANFSEGALTSAAIRWEIRNAGDEVMEQGAFPTATISVGKGFSAGTVSADLSKLAAPGAYKLVVRLDGGAGAPPYRSGDEAPTKSEYVNDWNFWVYPAQVSDAVPDSVLVTHFWSEAEAKLAAGGRVLFLPHNEDLEWDSPPLARVPVFWNALMGPTWSRMLGLWCETNHPALAEFPTEPNCDWQWTELLRNTRAINLDSLPRGLQPIVWAIDDWNRNYKLGVIFEARVGAGKLMVCSIDLDSNPSPVAHQLRRSLLDYMDGDVFQPATEISVGNFESLHFDTRIMRELGASALADGAPADEIIDGDPNTFWSSADRRGNDSDFPHEIEISFPQPVVMNGLVIMPRQNQREHQGDIREFKIQTSDDGSRWQDVAAGQLSSTFDEQKVLFGKTVDAKRLKLIALSGFGRDHSTSIAELAVIYSGPILAGKDSGEMKYKNVRTASPDIDGQ